MPGYCCASSETSRPLAIFSANTSILLMKSRTDTFFRKRLFQTCSKFSKASKSLFFVGSSRRVWSKLLQSTAKRIALTPSNTWIHFLRSPCCPPTSKTSNFIWCPPSGTQNSVCWIELVKLLHLRISWSDGIYSGFLISEILSRKLKKQKITKVKTVKKIRNRLNFNWSIYFFLQWIDEELTI